MQPTNRLPIQTKILRFFGGLAALLAVAALGFAIAYALIPTFGSTPAEASRLLPGDDLYPSPVIRWRHAITIDAAPETVWKWIAQIADDRAGFYSYMFIERLIDPQSPYINASRIHPEWQNPQPGQRMIRGQLAIQELEPNRYLLAMSNDPKALGWVWVWAILPAANGKTRMLVHMTIQTPDGSSPPALTVIMNLGAFIMERNMMTGLKLRAEGGSEPAWTEPLEMVLWFAALLSGLAAAVLYLLRADWRAPLLTGLAAVVALMVFTFLQPALLLRAVIDLALIGALARMRVAGVALPSQKSVETVPSAR